MSIVNFIHRALNPLDPGTITDIAKAIDELSGVSNIGTRKKKLNDIFDLIIIDLRSNCSCKRIVLEAHLAYYADIVFFKAASVSVYNEYVTNTARRCSYNYGNHYIYTVSVKKTKYKKGLTCCTSSNKESK